MIRQAMKHLWRFLRAPTFSPKSLLAWAVILSVLFLVCHLAGLRAYATIISGTSPTGDVTDFTVLFLAILYILSYVSFVVVVPTLTIAAAVFSGLESIARRGTQPKGAARNGA